MALTSGDLLLLNRSGLKTCQIGELAAKMQDTDLVMLDQGDGLRKATWSQRSSFNSSDLFTVGRGTDIYKTTWGAIQGFLTVEAEIVSANNNTATNEQVTLDDLFTSAQLASTTSKVITVKSGAVVGSTNTGVPALSISSSNTVNGTVTVINNGSIYGAGGTGGSANSGAGTNGGAAFSTSMNVTLINNAGGQIRGGGGGGGGGGKGGNGSSSGFNSLGPGSCVGNLPSAAENCQASCEFAYGIGSGIICNPAGGNCVQGVGPGCLLNQYKCQQCGSNTTVSTTGGDGGAGGNASGYNVAFSNGQSGAAGGNNAGNGGTGGDAGTWGTNGVVGGAGFNGNASNGSAGGAFGTAGASTVSNGNTITLTNTGILNGPQT